MLTKEPSFASLLVKQSPAMHYGHGWIYLPCGKKWHPSFELQPRQQAYREEIKSDSYKDLWLTWQTTCEPSEKFFLEAEVYIVNPTTGNSSSFVGGV